MQVNNIDTLQFKHNQKLRMKSLLAAIFTVNKIVS